jgi:transcriptional regulator with XRE-family HTH domain
MENSAATIISGPEEVGRKLRESRKQIGLTQIQLGEKLGIDQATISHFETGKVKSPTMQNLIKLGRFLNMNIDEIVEYFDSSAHFDIDLSPPNSSQSSVVDGVFISYSLAREILLLIEAARGGPQDVSSDLNRLMFQVSRHLPDSELPEYLGGQFS